MMVINRENILRYAQKYDEQYNKTEDERIEKKMKELLKKHRYFNREDFIQVGRWKSKRTTRWFNKNNANEVKDITSFCFDKENNICEETRIKQLIKLWGVGYPVASALLHFAFPERYPIMDFRTIWSLGWEQPSNYNFDFWQRYCEKIRVIATQLGLPIRTVDKALWKYSKENQQLGQKCSRLARGR